ncbi:restriction endonuclease subunit S [Clostridium perfringens]
MKVNDLFDVKYGVNLELNKCEILEDGSGINFVSRISGNNGVVAKVKKIQGLEPQEAGTISCAASGFGVLCSFIQKEPYYSGRDVYILTPKKEMSFNEKLFYCICLRKNAYKYAWNRQANKTLKDLELPDEVPNWVLETEIDYSILRSQKGNKGFLNLKINEWKEFEIGELFEIINGKKLPKHNRESGNIPLISTSKENNGVSDYIEVNSGVYKNILTVAYSGSVGATFYHEKDVFVGETVFVLKPKFELNKYIGLFLCTILNYFNSKYNYGRKIIGSRYKNEKILLPEKDGFPNWTFIENYMKELPYSDKI